MAISCGSYLSWGVFGGPDQPLFFSGSRVMPADSHPLSCVPEDEANVNEKTMRDPRVEKWKTAETLDSRGLVFYSSRVRKSVFIATAILLLLVGVPLALWVWEFSRPEQETAGRSTVQGVLSPGVRFTSWVSRKTAGALEYLVISGQARKENAAAREEIARLRAENAALRETILKFQRLDGAAALAEMNAWKGIAADVVARSGRPWTRSLVINRGSGSGVEAGDPVLHRDGLVGVVARVSPWTATVQLLNDPRTAVGVMVLPSRVYGVVLGVGKSGSLELMLEEPSTASSDLRGGETGGPALTPASAPRAGERVVTSGMSNSLYPPGLAVGEVSGESVENRFGQSVARVRPFVELGRVEEVLVLKAGRETHRFEEPEPSMEKAPDEQEQPTESR